MSLYRIVLLDHRGAIAEVRSIEFASDQRALDHVGALEHPFEAFVMQGARFVVRVGAPTGDFD